MATYHEQIAQMRAARQQVEAQARVDELRREYSEIESLRNSATDARDWHDYDRRCEELETEYLRMLPPEARNPQAEIPGVGEFAQRYRGFFERHGQRALQVCALADTYATRPRNPHSAQDTNAGMGLQRGSAQYWDAMPKLLEMYGGQFGVNFDPSEASLSPDDAAALSGVSADEYNEMVHKMWDAGHNSDALYGDQWGRKSG
jgi:hypothetical protein